jgi:hypothetical protein
VIATMWGRGYIVREPAAVEQRTAAGRVDRALLPTG